MVVVQWTVSGHSVVLRGPCWPRSHRSVSLVIGPWPWKCYFVSFGMLVRDLGLGEVDEEWLMWVLSSTLCLWLMVRQRTVVVRPGTHAEL